jgi:hypothetical protein
MHVSNASRLTQSRRINKWVNFLKLGFNRPDLPHILGWIILDLCKQQQKIKGYKGLSFTFYMFFYQGNSPRTS